MDYKAILFDLDGTLIETAYEIADAVNDTLEKFNLPPVDDEKCKNWIGLGTLHLVHCALSFVKSVSMEDVINDKETSVIYDYFKERYFSRTATRSWMFEGAVEVLEFLKKSNIKTAVITNKETMFTHKLMEKNNLTDLLDVVISGDTFDVKKPNSYCIDYVMEKFKITNKKGDFISRRF